MNNGRSLRLPSIISDGMILQRHKEITLWGWDRPKQGIQINFQGQLKEVQTSWEGRWSVTLGPFSSGGPYEMIIKGSEKKIISDIYMGEVWMAGGQSNMELPLQRTLDLYQEEISNTHNPLIREFHVPMEYNFHDPQEEEKNPSSWRMATQENIAKFSAAGYFFAQKLQEELEVPVGIVLTAIGGTPAEAWLSKDDLQDFPSVLEELNQLMDEGWIEKNKKKDEERIGAWYEQVNKLERKEQNEPLEWVKECYDDSDWKEMNVPTMFHHTELVGKAGSIWFRKKFFVSNLDLFEGEALLRIGAIIDYDEAYLNGELVGKTEYRYPPRRYSLPQGLLRKGENILAVRVIINGENGGFIPRKFYGIEGARERIDLSGSWKYKRVTIMESLTQMTFFQYKPTGLYNGMLYPIRKYVIKGFLFYQGESNTHHPENYASLMKRLIKRWRETWQDPTLPFLYVQLANYKDDLSLSQDTHWAELREQQAIVEREVEGTAMTVSVDVGEGNDLHPQNKRTIGRRLAEDALQIAYGNGSSFEKPILTKVEQIGSQVTLCFAEVAGNLYKQNNYPYMEVEYENGNWETVQSYAEGKYIVLDVEGSRIITGVRYAWNDNPEYLMYFNGRNYPLAPFRVNVPYRESKCGRTY